MIIKIKTAKFKIIHTLDKVFFYSSGSSDYTADHLILDQIPDDFSDPATHDITSEA